MIKSYKYRLYPNKEQAEKLQWTLDRCRELYNACLQERRDTWQNIKQHPNFYDLDWRKDAVKKHNINFYTQSMQLPEIKRDREEYLEVYGQVQQDVLHRVDKAFKSFFARCKRGDTPGFPRFQGKDRYDSFCFPQSEHGFSLTHDNRVTLSKIGSIKVKLHREIQGKIKTCTVKREGQQWYVVFVCEVEAEKLPVSYEDVGIDLGVMKLATLSNGETIEHPRHLRHADKKLEALHQSLSRKKRGSHRRTKAKKALSAAHRKVRNQRTDYLHKASRMLVNRYQVIVFEDLQTANLTKRPKPKQDETTGQYLPNNASAKAGLNKSILDAGWGMFVAMTTYKAECAGRAVRTVNPKYTSQVCSGCGTVKKKELSERWHSCDCGCELDRDVNAAINILRLGHSQHCKV